MQRFRREARKVEQIEDREENEGRGVKGGRRTEIYHIVSDRAIKLSQCGSAVGRDLVSQSVNLTRNGTRLLSVARKERKRETSKGGGSQRRERIT